MKLKKILVSGIVAGIVMNVFDFITNALILGKRWEESTKALNANMECAKNAGMYWMGVDLALGIILMWIYASIRPRYGAGPRTAMIAGLMVWLCTSLIMDSFIFMGLYPWQLVVSAEIGGFIAVMAGALAGGYLYKEKGR